MAAIRFLMLLAILSAIGPARGGDEPAQGANAAATTAPGKSDPGRPDKLESPRALVAQLGDPRFEIREEATRKLELAGLDAVAPLLEAATSEHLEITCRAIRALGAMLDRTDDAAFDASELALEKLEASGNRSAARRAAAALAMHSVRRWNRGMARFKSLGGWIKVNDRGEQPAQAVQTGAENALAGNLMISRRWKGGDSGLIHVQRIIRALEDMGHINFPAVYVIDGADVAPQGLAQLRQALPGLRVEARGEARLGVSFENLGRPCVVSGIERDSAVERAGMHRGDTIVSYDGEKLDDFSQLTEITRRHKVGDRVVLEVLRNGDLISLEAQLSGWEESEPKPVAK